MRSLFVFFALLFPFTSSFGNIDADTVYLDSEWKQTSKAEAIYFRTIVKDSRGYYFCQDFWITGETQMVGRLSSLYPANRQGQFTWYHKNGSFKKVAVYRNNEIVGTFQTYDSDGNPDLEVLWEIDSLDNGLLFRERMDDFRRHVSKNLKYPEGLRVAEIEGRVRTHFYVDGRGKINRFEIISSPNVAFSNEARRVIESYWRWPKPRYKGRSVWIEYTFPVNFVLM